MAVPTLAAVRERQSKVTTFWKWNLPIPLQLYLRLKRRKHHGTQIFAGRKHGPLSIGGMLAMADARFCPEAHEGHPRLSDNTVDARTHVYCPRHCRWPRTSKRGWLR
jgi:hypothetical protein